MYTKPSNSFFRNEKVTAIWKESYLSDIWVTSYNIHLFNYTCNTKSWWQSSISFLEYAHNLSYKTIFHWMAKILSFMLVVPLWINIIVSRYRWVFVIQNRISCFRKVKKGYACGLVDIICIWCEAVCFFDCYYSCEIL